MNAAAMNAAAMNATDWMMAAATFGILFFAGLSYFVYKQQTELLKEQHRALSYAELILGAKRARYIVSERELRVEVMLINLRAVPGVITGWKAKVQSGDSTYSLMEAEATATKLMKAPGYLGSGHGDVITRETAQALSLVKVFPATPEAEPDLIREGAKAHVSIWYTGGQEDLTPLKCVVSIEIRKAAT